MADFTIKGIAYQSRLMDGVTQVLVLKRLLPAFTALVGCAPNLSKAGEVVPQGDDDGALEQPREIHDIVLPVVRELADLGDDDVNFILNACLEVTKRQAAGGGIGWVSVRQKGIVQDQVDAKFITSLTIAWHVLGENFAEMLASFGLDTAMLTKAAPQARAF